MSRFVGDARDFQRVDEPRLLVVADDLLDELGVLDDARDEQERAVKEWLSDNEPNKVLAFSLRKDGFLAENVSNKLSNEPRQSGPDDAGRSKPETTSDLHQHGRSRTSRHRTKPGSSGS